MTSDMLAGIAILIGVLIIVFDILTGPYSRD